MDENNTNSPLNNSDTAVNENTTEEKNTINTYSEPVRSAFDIPESHPVSPPPQPTTYQNGNYYYSTEPIEDVAQPGTGLGIASLILGILSILSTCCCGLGILLGIIGLILGCVQPKDTLGKRPGIATIGIILSVIGIVLGILVTIIMVIPSFFA